jgi:ankyrin repeat protein
MTHSHSTSFNKYNTNGTRPEDYQNQLMESLQSSMSSLSLTAVTKLKRSASHKRKLIKKMPLIKKELEEESNLNKNTERLIQSIIECNVNNLKKSIDNGANVNIKYNNWSLLHYACSMIDQAHFGTEQHLEMIRILLENGAEINTLDEDRWTPLHLACQQGMTSVIS